MIITTCKILIMFAGGILALSACKSSPHIKHSITLINNDSKSIGYYFALGGRDGNTYPDTVPPVSVSYVGKELESDKRFIYYFGGGKSELIQSLPNDTLSVYIFSTDTLKRYSWEEVRSGYKVLRRYNLSLSDLNRLDWTLTYPPTDNMRDVNMFPAYR